MLNEIADGMNVPTYFANRIVATKSMGPCVALYFAAVADGQKVASPDLCVIWDINALKTQRDLLTRILNAIAPAVQANLKVVE